MRLNAAEALPQKGGDVYDPCGEPMAGKQRPDPRQAQRVPMILIDLTHDVFRNFIHAKKPDADAEPGDPANLPHRPDQAIRREVFEEIVNET